MSTKGQTIVHLQLRNIVGAASGAQLAWHVLTDGSLKVRAKTKSVMDLAGKLKAPKDRHVAVEEMNAWR